jgi:hypothetical protein
MRGRIYVGTSLRNAERANKIQQRFEEAGCEITYDWTKHGQVYTPADLEKIGVEEEKGVETADVFFLVFPARKGSHCELGLARGFGKKIVLLAEPLPGETHDTMEEKKTFYWLPKIKGRPAVSRFRDENEAIQFTLNYLDQKYERSNTQ